MQVHVMVIHVHSGMSQLIEYPMDNYTDSDITKNLIELFVIR
jgi:hypothetical protein